MYLQPTSDRIRIYQKVFGTACACQNQELLQNLVAYLEFRIRTNDEDDSCCSTLHGNLQGCQSGKIRLCDDKSSQSCIYTTQKRGYSHVIGKQHRCESINSKAASKHVQQSTCFLYSSSSFTLRRWGLY